MERAWILVGTSEQVNQHQLLPLVLLLRKKNKSLFKPQPTAFSRYSCHYLKHLLMHIKIWISRFLQKKKKNQDTGPRFSRNTQPQLPRTEGLSVGCTGFQWHLDSLSTAYFSCSYSYLSNCYKHLNLRSYYTAYKIIYYKL